MKKTLSILGLFLFTFCAMGAGLTVSSLNGVATNLTQYGTAANLAVAQPSAGTTNVIGIDSTGHEVGIPAASFGGGGATIAHTSNLISGDGAGNGVDSGVSPSFLQTLTNQTIVALIPTMTDNTHPSGTASASSIAGAGNDAWKAMDGNVGTFWSPAGAATTNWVQYQLTNSAIVTSYTATLFASKSFLFFFKHLVMGLILLLLMLKVVLVEHLRLLILLLGIIIV